MAITTYAQLRDAVAGNAGQSWSHRSDILSRFDDFLALTEEEIYTGDGETDGLKVRQMETTDTDTLSTSVRTRALPTGYIEFRKLNLEYSSTIYPPLTYRTPHELKVYSSAGHPCHYTVTSQIEFDRIPDVAYTLNRVYLAKLTAISSSNSTNAILTNFPSIYLYGCMKQMAIWAHNDARALQFNNIFMGAIKKANDLDGWGKLGPTPTMIYQGSVA